MKNKLFDLIFNLFDKKYLPTRDILKKELNKYVLHNYFSMDKYLVHIINDLERYDIPVDIEYLLLYYFLPKKRMYIKYHKENNIINEDIDNIKKKYNVSDEIAKEYIKILNKEN